MLFEWQTETAESTLFDFWDKFEYKRAKIVLLEPWFINWASDYINYDKDIQDGKCSLFREAIIKIFVKSF